MSVAYAHKAVVLAVPFCYKLKKKQFWHLPPVLGTMPIPSALSRVTQGMRSSSWNAMAQMLSLFHSPFAFSRACVHVYMKKVLGQNITWSYWITPALFLHSWKSWHLVISAECVPGHSNLLRLYRHFAVNHHSREWKRFTWCFLMCYFFQSLRIT